MQGAVYDVFGMSADMFKAAKDNKSTTLTSIRGGQFFNFAPIISRSGPAGAQGRRSPGWVSISVLWHLNTVCFRLFTTTVDQDGGRVRDSDPNVFERT